jgi:hypothetical protein
MPTDTGIRQREQAATTQSIDANKELVRRFVQEIFVDGNADAVDELVAEDFVPHTWPSTGDGRGDLKRSDRTCLEGSLRRCLHHRGHDRRG